jgi:hypothetical protein
MARGSSSLQRAILFFKSSPSLLEFCLLSADKKLMKYMKVLRSLATPTLLLMLLGSNQAVAANPYSDCVLRQLNESFYKLQEVDKSATKIEISTWQRGVPPRLVNQIHNWVQEVNHHLGKLTAPEFIFLDINPHGTLAEASSAGNIHISAFFGEGLQELKLSSERATKILRSSTKPAFQHEYGHQIFRTNIWKFSPSYHQSLDLNSAKRLKQLLSERTGVRKKWKLLVKLHQSKPWLLTERPDLKQRLTELNLKLKSMSKEIDELSTKIESEVDEQDYVGGRSAYEELFADTIAVLAAKDPKVISSVADDMDRDFSTIHAIKGWTKSDVHNAYSPVRSYLYQNYLKNPETLEHPEHLLESLLKAIGERIDIAKRGQENEPTVEELNLRLIATFEKYMKTGVQNADSKDL